MGQHFVVVWTIHNSTIQHCWKSNEQTSEQTVVMEQRLTTRWVKERNRF